MSQELLSAPSTCEEKRTYEEFLSEYEGVHAEWVNGETIEMSPVNKQHQLLGRFLINLLSFYVDAYQCGEILYEPYQMKTGPDLPGRSPDLMFIANENLSRLKANYLEGPADLVVEIISPLSGPRDRGEKFYEYEEGGVREYWLLDPQRKQAECYVRGADGYFQQVRIDGATFTSGVLPDLTLQIEWLWQEPLPSISKVLKEMKLI